MWKYEWLIYARKYLKENDGKYDDTERLNWLLKRIAREVFDEDCNVYYFLNREEIDDLMKKEEKGKLKLAVSNI